MIETAGGVVAEWLSLRDAATLTSMSVKYIRREVVAGRIDGANKGTPRRAFYRVRVADLKEFMERRTAGAMPALSRGAAKQSPKPISRHARVKARG